MPLTEIIAIVTVFCMILYVLFIGFCALVVTGVFLFSSVFSNIFIFVLDMVSAILIFLVSFMFLKDIQDDGVAYEV